MPSFAFPRMLFVKNLTLRGLAACFAGWEAVEYNGNANMGAPAYDVDYTAEYGLFGIKYTSTGASVTVGYDGWAVTHSDTMAFTRVHGARVAASIAVVASLLTCFSYWRSVLNKVEVAIFTTKRMYALSSLSLTRPWTQPPDICRGAGGL
jgi:hypothetical protein